MAYRIITIPFDSKLNGFSDEELNSFCLNKRILDRKVEFFSRNGEAWWTLFLEYDPLLAGDEKTTSRLNEPDQLLYQRLKEWRKMEAEKNGMPVFIVATNRELLELVRLKPTTLEGIKQIRGFGRKKLERYGKPVLKVISEFLKPDE